MKTNKLIDWLIEPKNKQKQKQRNKTKQNKTKNKTKTNKKTKQKQKQKQKKNTFVPHANEIWTKSYGPNYTKLWAFCQKTGVFKTIFDKALTPF